VGKAAVSFESQYTPPAKGSTFKVTELPLKQHNGTDGTHGVL